MTSTLSPESAATAAAAPGALDPYRMLAARTKIGWAGLVVGIICMALGLGGLAIALHAERTSPRVFVVDAAGSVHSGPLVKLAGAEEFFSRQGVRASLLAFCRTATSDGVVVDNVEEVELMFSERGREALNRDLSIHAKDFAVRQLSQKPRIERVRVLKPKDGIRMVSVKGKLERTGNFDGRASRELVPFSAVFLFVQNVRMEVGEYPYVVSDLQVRLGDSTLPDEK